MNDRLVDECNDREVLLSPGGLAYYRRGQHELVQIGTHQADQTATGWKPFYIGLFVTDRPTFRMLSGNACHGVAVIFLLVS
jgi:hypothetical protein